ncbi:phage tail protein [Mesorhizobium sp.]|uniref:GTA baseplate fiber-binding domain-containing protein n=1 Tax=Mesorhizobium sp. TaxID=1871066 RepID=UPI001219F1F8|nr:phage tail protein [Mesorhizobium sp.]TIR00826.1 MAG: hypothetical protein E5X36_03580 [Mesorhizobium sp.]
MSGLADLRKGTVGHWIQGGTTPSAPEVPEASPIQTTLPTSAYGQTIPVVWGKCRLPAAYIWVPPILTVTSTHTEWWDQITTTTSFMSCRLRFARPLVPNSTWAVRRIWCNGKLIYDASNGYRAKGLKFRAYDGRSSQDRDPTMTKEEGTSNVSAHRGYLDIVLTDFDIQGFGAPPVFEAEWIQGGAPTHDYDTYTVYSGSISFDYMIPVWDQGKLFGFDLGAIYYYSIFAAKQYFSVDLPPDAFAYYALFRYSRTLDRLTYLGSFDDVHNWKPVLIDAETGAIVETSSSSAISTGIVPDQGGCLVDFASSALVVGFSSDNARLFSVLLTATDIAPAFESASGWEGYASLQCITPGAVRGSDADFYVCADTDLVKVTLTSQGTLKSTAVVASFADDLRYCIYDDDGDLVVWTDAGTVSRVAGTTGAVEYTKTVPYQIAAIATRNLLAPDLQRLTDELYFTTGGTSYFTDLKTGLTRSVAGADASVQPFAYDGETDTGVTMTLGVPRRIRLTTGDGALRQLSDFLSDLMVYGGGYDPSQIAVENVEDLIQAAVVDITAGARDVARATCEPYSISIFERSGKIIFKRALTDGAFAVDQVIASAGDTVDSGGQAIKAKRYNPEEFIARYGISYRDPDAIYQTRTQFGEIPALPLPVAPADDSAKANMPIIVDADTVKTLATQRVNRLALEKHEMQMTLRAKYGDAEPEDIIRFVLANRLVTARVKEMTLRPDYMADVVCTEFLSSVSVSISGASGRPTEPDPVGTPDSRYYHLDIPLLADADDLSGSGLVQYHVLASAGQPYWDGATLFRNDATGLYQPVSGQVTNGIAGVALEALADWDLPYVTELTRTLTVAFISGDPSTLTSATYLEVMNGANFFAIGQPGRWEVCQVLTITNNGDGTYTFEGLRRGRMSSEEYTATHQAGDLVVWLSGGNVQNIGYAIAALDDEFAFKAVGLGGAINTTTAVLRTVTGEAEKIPKPCSLTAVINGSDIDLGWIRRSRIGSYWADDGGYEAPLGESLEQYVVRIKDGPAGTVVHTFTVDNATTKKYLAADIAADLGGMPAQLTFDARQVSGTGVICPAREVTVDL